MNATTTSLGSPPPLAVDLLRVEKLIFAFDFAMWLLIRYEGQPLSTKVKLVDSRRQPSPDDLPSHAASALIDKFCVACTRTEMLVDGIRRKASYSGSKGEDRQVRGAVCAGNLRRCGHQFRR